MQLKQGHGGLELRLFETVVNGI